MRKITISRPFLFTQKSALPNFPDLTVIQVCRSCKVDKQTTKQKQKIRKSKILKMNSAPQLIFALFLISIISLQISVSGNCLRGEGTILTDSNQIKSIYNINEDYYSDLVYYCSGEYHGRLQICKSGVILKFCLKTYFCFWDMIC